MKVQRGGSGVEQDRKMGKAYNREVAGKSMSDMTMNAQRTKSRLLHSEMLICIYCFNQSHWNLTLMKSLENKKQHYVLCTYILPMDYISNASAETLCFVLVSLLVGLRSAPSLPGRLPFLRRMPKVHKRACNWPETQPESNRRPPKSHHHTQNTWEAPISTMRKPGYNDNKKQRPTGDEFFGFHLC